MPENCICPDAEDVEIETGSSPWRGICRECGGDGTGKLAEAYRIDRDVSAAEAMSQLMDRILGL